MSIFQKKRLMHLKLIAESYIYMSLNQNYKFCLISSKKILVEKYISVGPAKSSARQQIGFYFRMIDVIY